MAPLRRRASRRIVKSTFQECFEYDIAPPKNSVTKRPPSLPVSRPKKKVISSQAKKLELHSRSAKAKAKAKLSKGIARAAITRAAETLNRKEKDSIKNTRNQVKTGMVSSTAKTGSSETDKSTPSKSNSSLNKAKKTVKQTENQALISQTIKTEAPFNSEEWQPVVNLEKIRVDGKKRNVANSSKPVGTRRHMRSLLSGNANKTSVSDESLMLTSDTESEKESSSNISLDEELKGLENSSVSSSSDDVEGNDTGFEELNKSKSSVLESPQSQSSLNNQTNDSVLEDWPEDSSDSVGSPEAQFSRGSDTENINALDNGFRHDWSSPQVTQLMHLQENFHFITNDLRSSFENLKTIIEDKNVLIESFKSKLQTYMGNKYHQMLEKVLQKYGVNDPDSPVIEIIETLRKYAEAAN